MIINKHTKLERDVVKVFNKKLWYKFVKAIKKYQLVEDGDKIAVTMSGGKDSLIMAKLFQELKRHPEMTFELVFISMNPGYHQENLELLKKNAKALNIPIIIKDSRIFDVVKRYGEKNPCYLCAKMRRGFLYNFAKEQGCNKLALGHHMDDVIETTLMNMFYAGEFKTMLPKVKSENFEGIELIRPMYLIKEKDIQQLIQLNNIETMGCGCDLNTCVMSSKRMHTKRLIETLKKEFDDIDKNIFRAAENVNLDSVYRWKKDDQVFTFYDDYNQE